MRKLIIALAAASLAPLAQAAEISVGYSDEFQEKLTDDYGAREGEKLVSDIREDIEHAFNKAGIDPAKVTVTIVDAKPNRPTMKQMTDQPGLDMLRSKSIGGMKLVGTAYDASGTVLGEVEYDWYESDIRQVYAAGVWQDANRASRNFARRLAEQISN
ncbi:hypothetical protein WNY37_17540 [Henriciella sp. AS95]|uniref:hypothetical protein n=1 Tax=Henriciella sp. AS95 TaxID=3135782 RepID=UPI0031741351